MKALRAISFIIGFGAVIFTCIVVWRDISLLNHFGVLPFNHFVELHFRVLKHVVLSWPLTWYYFPKAVISDPSIFLKISPISCCEILIAFSSPFLAIALSKKLDRSRLDWFVLVLVFPFFLTLLSLIKTGRASQNPYGGMLGRFFATCTGKSCGRCGKAVPLSSRAGQKCPFCGAYWSYERSIYRN